MNERKTPLMGWASWNAFRTDISEENLKKQANALVDTGLAEAGYTYLNIDDGYFGGRGEDGKLRFHKERFPNGIKPVADYAHNLGLKAGIYSDAGPNTCAHYFDNEGPNGVDVGLFGHDKEDLEMFFKDLGFDFIKVDWCGGLHQGLNEKERYTQISEIIEDIKKETGRDIIFNVCRWQFPGKWVTDIADSWRVGIDIVPSFDSVLFELDAAKELNRFCTPGHVNDLDMLEVGNGMSPTEDEAHFAMWCMMSTPLMIGCDLTTMAPETLEILKNRELIELNQDPACLQAYVITNKVSDSGDLLGEVWLKDLGESNSKVRALAFLNRSDGDLKLKLDLKEAGLLGVKSVRDLIEHSDLEPVETLEVDLAPHQAKVFKVEASESKPVKNLDKQFDYTPFEPNRINLDEARDLVKNGGTLIDVRMPDDYEANHLDGAVSLPYFSRHTFSGDYEPYTDGPIVLYCNTGKRSGQAYQALKYLGYDNVYDLGGIDFTGDEPKSR